MISRHFPSKQNTYNMIGQYDTLRVRTGIEVQELGVSRAYNVDIKRREAIGKAKEITL